MDLINDQIDGDAIAESLAEFTIGFWRLSRRVESMSGKLDHSEQKRLNTQFNWAKSKLQETLVAVGLHIVNYPAGEPYDKGMPVTALNIADFSSEDALVIEQMLCPIVMRGDKLIATGQVMLRKQEE